MASPAEITQNLPDTLPADFGDWDGKSSPAAAPAASVELESTHTFGAASRPLAQSALYEAILAPVREAPFVPVVDRSRNLRSPLSPPVFADDEALLPKQKPVRKLTERESEAVRQKQKLLDALVDRLPTPSPSRQEASAVYDRATAPAQPPVPAPHGAHTAPERAASVMPQVVEGPFKAFQSTLEVAEEPDPAKKKWMIISAACATPVVLLLVFMLPRFHAASRPVANQAVQQHSGAVTETQPQSSVPAPSAENKPLASVPAQPATQAQTVTQGQPATSSQQDNNQQGAKPTPVQTAMMNDQLAAPSQIPQGSGKQVANNAPPSDSIRTDGLSGSGAPASAFSGQSQPSVQVARPKTFSLSAGVATGRLIYQSAPVYPAIAKQSHVSGTVEMAAIISETGSIKDLHVVSGPVMLRQAAVDAVRMWRYKPFMLDNRPIEVQTTINVIFSLDQ